MTRVYHLLIDAAADLSMLSHLPEGRAVGPYICYELRPQSLTAQEREAMFNMLSVEFYERVDLRLLSPPAIEIDGDELTVGVHDACVFTTTLLRGREASLTLTDDSPASDRLAGGSSAGLRCDLSGGEALLVDSSVLKQTIRSPELLGERQITIHRQESPSRMTSTQLCRLSCNMEIPEVQSLLNGELTFTIDSPLPLSGVEVHVFISDEGGSLFRDWFTLLSSPQRISAREEPLRSMLDDDQLRREWRFLPDDV